MLRPQSKHGAFARWLLAVASLGLVACSGGPSGFMPVNFGSLRSPAKADLAGDAIVMVKVETPRRKAQSVPLNWASIKVTLSNASLLQSNKVSIVDQTAGSTVTSVFTGLRPGASYAVSVVLYDSPNATGTTLKTGATSGVTLVSGPNNVTINLIDPGSVSGAISDAVPSSITLDGGTFNLNSPAGVVVDSSGNLFFTDSSCRILKKNSTNGTYSVLAGDGVCATSAPAIGVNTGTAARLINPRNMTIDSSDNIYFNDTTAAGGTACVVRKVTPLGEVSTLFGSSCGFNNATGGSKFENPQGVVADIVTGILYVGDTGNHKIRQVNPSNNQASTVTGGQDGFKDDTSSAQVRFSFPKGVVLSADRTLLYVADATNNAVRIVTIATGATTTLAGVNGTTLNGVGFVDGASTSAKFSSPSGITLGGDGHLYVADTGNNAIRKVILTRGADYGLVSTVAGNGSAGCLQGSGTGTALLSSPSQVFRAADGTLYIANTGCNKISIVL